MPSSDVGVHGVVSARAPDPGPYSNASPTLTNASTLEVAAGVEEGDGATEVGGDELGGVGRPARVHRGGAEVEHAIGRERAHHPGQALVVAEVGDDGRVRTAEIGEPVLVGVGAHQRVDVEAATDLVAHDVGTDEPGRAGDEDGGHAKYR